MVDYVDAELFEHDSVDKQLHIAIKNTSTVLDNNDIVSESFQLIESLCSEECLMFGAVEPRSVKFTVKYSAPKLLNKWVTITMSLEGSQTPFEFGDYQVVSDKPSSNRETREVTAYSHYHKILRNTYKNWYKNAWGSSDSMTIKEFRDSFFARLLETHSWVVQETTTLPNDNAIIKKTKKIPRISGKDILNAICEINGVFGYIGRDGIFHYLRLDDNQTEHEIANTFTISTDYEDYTTTAIDRVQILSEDGDVLGAAGEDSSDAANTYTIKNNFMLKGLGYDDFAKDTFNFIASNLLSVMDKVTYVPFEAEFKGNPCFEIGDRIVFNSHGQEIRSYILERTMSGIQSLRDSYSAQGDEVYPEDTNTLSSKLSKLETNIGNVDVSKSTNNVGSSDVSTIDADNGDTYFKYVEQCTMFLKYSASNTTVSNLQQDSDGISFDLIINTSTEHETVIFQIDGLTVDQYYKIEWIYIIRQWNNSRYNAYTYGVGFSEVYPIQDANGYDVSPLGYPITDGQGVPKTKVYNGKNCHWYSFKFSSNAQSVTWLSLKATSKTMYLYFNFDEISNNQTFKWSIYRLKFTPSVQLISEEPKNEVSELYVNVDGEWNKYNGSLSFSTEEQDTGKKWINGKSIYQKTVTTGGGVPTGGTEIYRIEHAQTGYDTIFYTKS